MINLEERKLSSIGKKGIEKFLKKYPDCRAISMHIYDGNLYYTTFQGEKLQIVDNELRGYYIKKRGIHDYDFYARLDSQELKRNKRHFLCINEQEFEEMVETFMKKGINEMKTFHQLEINKHLRELNELETIKKWYKGLH